MSNLKMNALEALAAACLLGLIAVLMVYQASGPRYAIAIEVARAGDSTEVVRTVSAMSKTGGSSGALTLVRKRCSRLGGSDCESALAVSSVHRFFAVLKCKTDPYQTSVRGDGRMLISTVGIGIVSGANRDDAWSDVKLVENVLFGGSHHDDINHCEILKEIELDATTGAIKSNKGGHKAGDDH